MVRSWMLLAALTSTTLVMAAEPDPEPVVKPESRWQYAELHQKESPLRAAADGTPAAGKNIISWDTSTGKVTADSWEEMAKKLKTPAQSKAVEANHKLRVLDQLGSQGWELVGVESSTPRLASGRGTVTRVSNTWVFKRRLAK